MPRIRGQKSGKLRAETDVIYRMMHLLILADDRSWSELAAAAGVPERTIQNWIKGKADGSLLRVQYVLAELGCELQIVPRGQATTEITIQLGSDIQRNGL